MIIIRIKMWEKQEKDDDKILVTKKRQRDTEDMDAKVGQEGKEVKGVKRKDYKL